MKAAVYQKSIGISSVDPRFPLLIIGLFLYIFPVNLVGSQFPLAMFAYVIFLTVWAIKPIIPPISATPAKLAFVLLCLAFFSAFAALTLGSSDFTFAVQMAKVSTLYLGSGMFIALIFAKNSRDDSFTVLISAYTIVCLIQSAFISAAITSIPFRQALDSLILSSSNTDYIESFRVRGFAAGGGAALSLNQAFGVLSALYVLSATKKLRYFLFAVAIWVPTFFVGRTGFFLGGIFILGFFLIGKNSLSFIKEVLTKPRRLLVLLAMLISIPLVTRAAPNMFDYDAANRLTSAYDWGFELFINMGSGRAATATTDAVVDMLTIPSEPYHFLFGIGTFDSGAFGYERSDSGYIKTIYSTGIIGAVILYITIFGTLLTLARNVESRSLRIYLLLIVAVCIFVEIKEPFLYQNYVGRYIGILLGASGVFRWRERVYLRKLQAQSAP